MVLRLTAKTCLINVSSASCREVRSRPSLPSPGSVQGFVDKSGLTTGRITGSSPQNGWLPTTTIATSDDLAALVAALPSLFRANLIRVAGLILLRIPSRIGTEQGRG